MISINRPWLISAAAFSGVVLAVVILCLLAPDWIKTNGLDIWNASKLNEEFETETNRKRKLELKFEENKGRYHLKIQIIDKLLIGEISLKDATEQFFTIDQSLPGAMFAIRHEFKGDTDLERVARNVIRWARMRMKGFSKENAAVFARLKEELLQLTGAILDETFDSNDSP